MSCPYNELEDFAYWKRSVAAPSVADIDPLAGRDIKFQITVDDKIATAGSCFAQHIARYLSQSGYNHFVAEQAHSVVPEATAKKFGYGLFSCRYGNIYTTRQLLQLFKRAFGQFTPEDNVWHHSDGRFYDPYRPNIQPGGFEFAEEVLLQRDYHLNCVKRMFLETDVFVFTLGLTEGWYNSNDGAVYPACPGCQIGTHDQTVHQFKNFGIQETLADLNEILSLLKDANPKVRVILTVSPVPLIATYDNRHVLTATTYSKSVLRVAAEEASAANDWVSYFPSFEIITGHFNHGDYYASDYRSVKEKGVRHVMSVFYKHLCGQVLEDTPTNNTDQRTDDKRIDESSALTEVLCDEELMLEQAKD